MEIGQKLKNKRTEYGLSQEVLAEKIGVSRQTISSWENDRSYPDIGSILKLSDLYEVSLDELLKEDTKMRKHIEESADLTNRWYALLLDLAVVLIPVSMLLSFWDFYEAAVCTKVIGLVLLPILFCAGKKLYNWNTGVVSALMAFWAIYVISELAGALANGDFSATYNGYFYFLIALCVIYSWRNSFRYWLVIALFFCVPIYITVAVHGPAIMEDGLYNENVDVYSKVYRIEEIYGAGEDAVIPGKVSLNKQDNTLVLDGIPVGKLEEVEIEEWEDVRNRWNVFPEGNPEARYELEIGKTGFMTIRHSGIPGTGWVVRLMEVPEVLVTLKFTDSHGSSATQPMGWYAEGTYTEGETAIPGTTITGGAEICFKFDDFDEAEITVTEEYHHDGKVDIGTYILEKNREGEFPFPEELKARYDGSGQYGVYTINLDEGTYYFRLDFEK